MHHENEKIEEVSIAALRAKRKFFDSVSCESKQDPVRHGKINAFLIFLFKSSS